MIMKTLELKPCPFCGGEGSFVAEPEEKIIYCGCWDCGARSISFGYKNVPSDIYFNAAADAWNRRVHDDSERSH